jgi:DNA-binding transcriptional regulator YiaG
LYRFGLLTWHSITLKDILLSYVDDDLKVLSEKKIALETEQVDLQIAKMQAKKSNLRFELVVKNASVVSLLVILSCGLVIVSVGIHHKLSVHAITIGSSTLKVRYKDMQTLGIVQNGLVLAEQMRANSETEARSLEMSLRISEVVTRQLQAVAGRRGIFGHSQPVIDIAPHQPALPAPMHVPTFRKLMSEGYFQEGSDLIFGINTAGQIRSGTWVDLFSSAIGGQSGQGKTATLRSFISQSLLTKQVAKVWIIDYHFPHPKSLLATLGELKTLPQVKFAATTFDIRDILQEVEATIDRRLHLEEESEPVKILVCDEVLILAEKIPELTHIIKRIGTESRKCGVYGLFSSQVWKADSVGGSEVRDCLTSRVCHKMQPKQANLLLQDSEQSRIVKRLETGKALFSPVNGDPEVLSIPYCDPSDMIAVFKVLHQANTQKPEPLTNRESQTPPRRSASTPDHTPELEALWQEFEQSEQVFEQQTDSLNTVQTPFEQSGQVFKLTPDTCKHLRETAGISQAELAERAQVSLSKFKRFELKNAEFEPFELNQILAVLNRKPCTGA